MWRALFLLMLTIGLKAAAHTGSFSPVSCADLLLNYQMNNSVKGSARLIFHDVQGRDVYNPTKPFQIEFRGEMRDVIAARVEPRDSEWSEVQFFSEHEGGWFPLAGAPVFKMQDPFFTFINGELIFGGVEVFVKDGGRMGYRTVFYRGKALEEMNPLLPFARGPDGMKDIRLVQLNDKRIGLFTRPQGIIASTGVDAGPGRIGFAVIDSLADLTSASFQSAPIFEGQFAATEWGGVNEAQLLGDGRIAVLAHIARFDEQGHRHYYSVVFTVNVEARSATRFEMILERGDLARGLEGNSKRADLANVVFSGGLDLRNGAAVLFVGAGDAEVHAKAIQLPASFH